MSHPFVHVVDFEHCFRFSCPRCRLVNYVKGEPVTDPEMLEALKEAVNDSQGEEWKGEPPKELEQGWECMPSVAKCRLCGTLVRAREDG